MATIRLQNINSHLYPTDSISAGIMEKDFGLGRIPADKLWLWSPRIVKKGHSMAITGDIDNIDY
jgi:hypothetical protein